MKRYGELPINLGIYPIECTENMYYLYMPIKILGQDSFIQIEDRLKFLSPLIVAVLKDLKKEQYNIFDSYMYLTVKNMLITPEYLGNRPGYHSDGFMTDDINYIWCDGNPTIFNCSPFNLTMDENKSMAEMEQQALAENEVVYPAYYLLKLDQYNIHKVAPISENMVRTFVKISVSKDKYNLLGNTHNYLLDYHWEMHKRTESRNVPQKYNRA